MARKSRPLLVTIVGLILGIIALLLLITGVICFAKSGQSYTDIGLTEEMIRQIEELLRNLNISFLSLMNAVGAIYVVFGFIYLLLSAGTFKGWKFIWYLALIFLIICVILGIVTITQLITLGTLIWLVINILLVIYLFKPNVRKFFLG